jgi:hypothetical protein
VSEPTTADHPVYPGGPPCNPYCEGDWSTYHDGYGDGYDRANREARALLLDELEAAVRGLEHPPKWFPFSQSDILDRSDVLAVIQQHREAIR